MDDRMEPNESPKRKISEMTRNGSRLLLGVGDTIGERQNRLNAACTCLEYGLRIARSSTAAT